ncbi:fumarylacetoacetate hydrolase family protein [Bradyrhizobium yuanmingense]|uniref:fumarylacetoacetate hydrolase family protein n=1 Tax=Bradyrhizobium yuanmingense TaxID=108015 RepID=UPI0023B942CA|nr:fumarylacetoacetate hydrolase family protein [Bradyrhizobium yuanmingense]MDF0520148.1 fumarylacetoacetate hydrolase family protein [Bradyrhizobium yuanmingense]
MTINGTKVSSLNARLANLRVDGAFALGIEVKEGVLNLSATAAAYGLAAPHDVDDLLQNRRALDVGAVLDAVERDKSKAIIVPIAEVSFAPLVTRPEKIICVGFNYREHAAETNTPIPAAPPLFNKFNNALNGHGGVVHLPTRVARQFDYETELVIVFGEECRDVPESDALDVVAGYATGNDISARELQTRTSQFLAGKTSDGFGPVGPWLVTRDRVSDPNALRLQTWVNGKVRQDWNTRDMIFNCRQLISYASGIMTIKPGDILFTGTPQGVILGEKAPREERQWLKAGDEIVSSVEGLGELRVSLA